MNSIGCDHCCAIPPDAPGPECWCDCHDDSGVTCDHPTPRQSPGWRYPVTMSDELDEELVLGVFGPVNGCCGVTASVGHDLYCENRPSRGCPLSGLGGNQMTNRARCTNGLGERKHHA